MYQIILKPKAVAMTEQAYNWYETQRVGLGEIFLSALDVCYKKLQINPNVYRRVHKHYRQATLKKFPYVITYEIIKNEVVVLYIFHTKRNIAHKGLA